MSRRVRKKSKSEIIISHGKKGVGLGSAAPLPSGRHFAYLEEIP